MGTAAACSNFFYFAGMTLGPILGGILVDHMSFLMSNVIFLVVFCVAPFPFALWVAFRYKQL